MDRYDLEQRARLSAEHYYMGIKELLYGYTYINWVGQGMLHEVHDAVSEPSRFGFDVAIHLRLLVVWGNTPSNRTLQRSIAEQLGIIDEGDTRALLDVADEDDDYEGVEEEKRGVVEEVANRIYRKLENKRCLIILDNVTDEEWDGWRMMGFPRNACQLVLSSPEREEANDLVKITRFGFSDGCQIFTKWMLDDLAEGVAASLNKKMLAIAITPDHVVKSLMYWWLFKPFQPVPVEELVNSWMDAEVLSPSLGSLEVGKALLEELCRHYLLKVRRRDDGVGWNREPLDVRQPSRSSGALQASFSWMGMSVDKEEALLVRGDGTAALLTWGHIAPAFLRRHHDGDWSGTTFDRSWGSILHTFLSSDDDDDDGRSAPTLYRSLPPEVLESLTTFFTATGRADVDAATTDWQPDTPYDLQHVNIISDHMPRMTLLDLSYTNISSLPDSLFFCLPELKALLLRHCPCFEALTAPTSLAHRKSTLNKLRVLDLSYSSVREISDDVLLFHMTNLEELLLSQVPYLTRLPTVRALNNLRVFRLTRTSLEGTLPEEGEGARLLLQHMPGLRIFTFSNSSVSRVSLRGCSRLETIELSNLEQLEVLDLSGTAIKELPVEILNLPRLRRLDLLGVQQLRRIPWRAAKRIPQVLNLDQCSCDLVTGGPAPEEEPTTGSQLPHIFAVDPRILDQNYSSTNWLPIDYSTVAFIRENLPCFYVCISPCNHRVEEAARRFSMVRTRRNLIPYETIQPTAKKMVKKDVSLNDGICLPRHVDVQGGGGRFLHAASMFLVSADSLSLRDHHYDNSLTILNPTYSWENLKRCRLERCHNMDCVFSHRDRFECLESLWISKLPRLTKVWDNRFSYRDKTTVFKNLRYVHLEYCPRVVSVFHTDIHLPSLENLVIKSCPRLERVFAPPDEQEPGPDEEEPGEQQANLSGLKRMELLDLPSLESISRDKILSPRTTWKLKVRGCWKLRELPTMIAQPDAPGKVSVEIDGEPKWWNNLAINNNTITVIKKK